PRLPVVDRELDVGVRVDVGHDGPGVELDPLGVHAGRVHSYLLGVPMAKGRPVGCSRVSGCPTGGPRVMVMSRDAPGLRPVPTAVTPRVATDPPVRSVVPAPLVPTRTVATLPPDPASTRRP